MQVPPFSLSEQISALGTDLDEAVLNVLRSGQYIGGQEVGKFETAFANSVGASHAVSCNSGTDALILALRALDIGKGDEVITASFSFFATAEAISSVGAKPVLVDIDPKNYLIDLEQIELAITSASKAIIPVHLFGCPVNMDKLMTIAKKHNLKVIEDCAQSAGSKWNERFVGAWGDIGCFSFFPTKNLGAAGDAGAVITNDLKLAKRMRELAIHGMPRRYLHSEIGYNSRMDAIQAAVLNIKLPKLSQWISKRQLIAAKYHDELKGIDAIKLPQKTKEYKVFNSWNQYVIRVSSDSLESKDISINSMDGSFSSSARDQLKDDLAKNGINTIIYYPIPIHLQPAYKSLGYRNGSLPITEKICAEVLSLPIFPELSLDQQNFVCKTLQRTLSGNRNS